MLIGGRKFDIENNCYVMGILNVTPDSFYDGGRFDNIDIALKRAEEMIKEGADIIDIGGQSTRPNHIAINSDEEIKRTIPIIEKIKSEFDIPISLDTYDGVVAKAGIEAGIDLINDVWGLKYDEIMANVIAESKLPCVLMHNRSNSNYHNFLDEVIEDISNMINHANRAGIEDDKIIIDVGVGFAKDYNQNLRIMNEMNRIRTLGYPLLLGASRKSCIQKTLELEAKDCLEGTLATSVVALVKGCSFVRVHDVKENMRAIKMAKAILDS